MPHVNRDINLFMDIEKIKMGKGNIRKICKESLFGDYYMSYWFFYSSCREFGGFYLSFVMWRSNQTFHSALNLWILDIVLFLKIPFFDMEL